MRIPALAYAAELEQAVAASDLEDRALDAGFPVGVALNDVVDRYGFHGEDMISEYQNDIYAITREGRAPAFVLFH